MKKLCFNFSKQRLNQINSIGSNILGGFIPNKSKMIKMGYQKKEFYQKNIFSPKQGKFYCTIIKNQNEGEDDIQLANEIDEDPEKTNYFKSYLKQMNETTYKAYAFVKEKSRSSTPEQILNILLDLEKKHNIKLTPPFWSFYIKSVFLQKSWKEGEEALTFVKKRNPDFTLLTISCYTMIMVKKKHIFIG